MKVLWAFSLEGPTGIIAAFSSGSRKLGALGESQAHLLTHCRAGDAAQHKGASHMSTQTRARIYRAVHRGCEANVLGAAGRVSALFGVTVLVINLWQPELFSPCLWGLFWVQV